MQHHHLLALIDDLRQRPSEATLLEFKESNADPKRMGRMISAIANAAAAVGQPHGYIVWGVEDGSHEVVGTTFDPGHQKVKGQPLEFALAQGLSPSVAFNGRVVVLQVPAAERVPLKFEGHRLHQNRICNTKLSEYPEREAQLLAQLRSFVWELEVAREFVTDEEVLHLLSAETYFRLTGLEPPSDPKEILKHFKTDRLISEDAGGRWKILNFGALLFANRMADFATIERKSVRVIQYRDVGRITTIREIKGTKGYAPGYEALGWTDMEGSEGYLRIQIGGVAPSVGRGTCSCRAEYQGAIGRSTMDCAGPARRSPGADNVAFCFSEANDSAY